MKRLLSVVLVFLLCANMSVYAQQKPISVYIDNKPISFDVSPIVENGRTLVPMRAIFEALNVNVEWDTTTQTVIAATEYLLCLELQIGNLTAKKYFRTPADDFNFATNTGSYRMDQLQSISLDVAPKLMHNRTMVPLRFIAESMGYQVSWDAKTQRVDIITGQFVDLANLLSYRSHSDIKRALNIPDNEPSFDKQTSLVAKWGYMWLVKREESPLSFAFLSPRAGILMEGVDSKGIQVIQMLDTTQLHPVDEFPEIQFEEDLNSYSFQGIHIGDSPNGVASQLGVPILSNGNADIYLYGNESFVIWAEYDDAYKQLIRLTILSEDALEEETGMRCADVKELSAQANLFQY